MSTSTEQDKNKDHAPHQLSVIVNGRSATVTDKELTFD